MNYISTRDPERRGVSAAAAIRSGLAPDGGLYMPERIPVFSAADFAALAPLTYPERAAKILAPYLPDFSAEDLLADARAAYTAEKFGAHPAPVTDLAPGMSMLELFHGPTCAFKDMALQLMPRLFVRALAECGETRQALILVATSGDTGKAALEGFSDLAGVKISVFYPEDGVSRLQKLQMQTQRGENVDVHGIRGNFDDAQSAVKRVFASPDVRDALNRKGVFLSSANSINWGRLVPQIVYYISAYLDLLGGGKIAPGEKIDVVCPTGNFGNIFAALLAKRMGLPVGKLVCASNENHVLTDFFRTGVYDRNRPFFRTMSPSMDILLSSNLERLLFLTLGAEKTARHSASLSRDGRYALDPCDLAKISEEFSGYFTTEDETKETVRTLFARRGILIDPHTAVALHAARQYRRETAAERHTLVVSTASPYKFAGDVLSALTGTPAHDVQDAPAALSLLTKTPVPAPLAALEKREILHTAIIDPDDIEDSVLAFAAE